MGPVNVTAVEDYRACRERYDDLARQRDDLVNAQNDLLDIIDSLQKQMERQFIDSFHMLQEYLSETFTKLFGGGHAELRLTDESNVLGCGIGGVAGMLYALYYGSLSASMGGMATMKAFSSSVLGGLVDIQASAIGGLLIGISENYGIALFSSSLRDMIAFVFLIIVLIFFPKGLRIKIGRKAK